MKLLIVTQAVDAEDPVLGFFVRWIEEFAKHCEKIEVICLKEGKYILPANVRVHSLGKERGAKNRMVYTLRFLSFVWKLRNEYDVVFVHMNQEYILLAGGLWKLLGKRIYLWRNHYAGSIITDIVAAFCTKIFCTSKYSYIVKFEKNILMPVGVDTERFKPDARITRKLHTILFLARMAPSKRPGTLVDALAILARDDVDFVASFVGSPSLKGELFYEKLKEKVRGLKLADRIIFVPAVPNNETRNFYNTYDICVNTSPSGMYDKTIFEAAACGCLVLSSNHNLVGILDKRLLFEEGDILDLKQKLTSLLLMSEKEKQILRGQLQKFVDEHHSLRLLGDKLIKEMSVS
jgi:glycosyltransferase involved in cell wall biosynthesis